MITDAFADCPLCATSPRARVLRSCVDALNRLNETNVGETVVGEQRISLPKGHGLPPGAAATGHIDAMAMYAGESVADVGSIRAAADIVRSWCAAIAS